MMFGFSYECNSNLFKTGIVEIEQKRKSSFPYGDLFTFIFAMHKNHQGNNVLHNSVPVKHSQYKSQQNNKKKALFTVCAPGGVVCLSVCMGVRCVRTRPVMHHLTRGSSAYLEGHYQEGNHSCSHVRKRPREASRTQLPFRL